MKLQPRSSYVTSPTNKKATQYNNIVERENNEVAVEDINVIIPQKYQELKNLKSHNMDYM